MSDLCSVLKVAFVKLHHAVRRMQRGKDSNSSYRCRKLIRALLKS
jgi:hypothetical protein